MVKKPPANAGDTGSIVGLGRYGMEQQARALHLEKPLLITTRESPSGNEDPPQLTKIIPIFKNACEYILQLKITKS